MLVKDCMTPNPFIVGPDEDVKNVFSLLNKHRFRQVPVVKDGKLVGIVTDRDLRAAVMEENHLVVADIMSSNPVTVSEDAAVEEAARIIRERKFGSLPVVSKTGELIGIITVTDILNLLKSNDVNLPEDWDLYDSIDSHDDSY